MNTTKIPPDTLENKIRHEEKNTEQPKKKFWQDYEPIEKFTLVIAGFTIIYSIITFGLYIVSRNNMIISQKAFIAVNGAFCNSKRVGIELENTGQTPAREVIFKFEYDFTDRSRETYTFLDRGDTHTYIPPKTQPIHF